MKDEPLKPVKILIDIIQCNQCPYFKLTNGYSTDGYFISDFENKTNWMCSKFKPNKVIECDVKINEEYKIKVPDWCPIIYKS